MLIIIFGQAIKGYCFCFSVGYLFAASLTSVTRCVRGKAKDFVFFKIVSCFSFYDSYRLPHMISHVKQANCRVMFWHIELLRSLILNHESICSKNEGL